MIRFRHWVMLAASVCIFSCSGAASAGSRDTMAWFPSAKQGWRGEADMFAAVTDASAGAFDGKIYVIGGSIGDGEYTPTVQAYDPSSNKWSNLPPLPEARTGADGLGIINGKLYLAGGTNNDLYSDTLYEYDPAVRAWTTKAPMLHLSGCGVTGVIDSKLYVTTPCNGNSGGRRYLDVYDPATDTWTSLSDSNSTHITPAAAAINGVLYVAGGSDSARVISTTECYNPRHPTTWKLLKDMPMAVENATSVELDGKLWVFGGDDGSKSVRKVQVYDPVTNSWTVSPFRLPQATRVAVAAVVDGVAFMAGGQGASGNTVGSTYGLFVLPSIP